MAEVGEPASGDHLGEAFAQLRQSLRSYLRRRVSDPAHAEDLLQDIFVKALTSKRAGRRIENLTGWLYATARTTVVDYYRAAGRPLEELTESVPDVEADDLQLHQQLARCLKPFVEQLAPIYRDTLLATDFQGETMRALAESEGVSVSAIKSRAARARSMLKEKLLGCCRVEIADGLVTDFQRIPASSCRGKCE